MSPLKSLGCETKMDSPDLRGRASRYDRTKPKPATVELILRDPALGVPTESNVLPVVIEHERVRVRLS